MMKKLLIVNLIAALCYSLLLTITCQAQMLMVRKQRPPLLDISKYERIAIGDITGSSGLVSERSMDLSDQLTSILFNAHSLEVIDRNALGQLLSSDRGSEIKTINEQTTAALSKKLNSAIIIVGRIQNEKVYNEQKSVRNIIVSNGCYESYWWHLSGDITVQIKILDVKTGRMLFSNPVVKTISIDTKQECAPYRLGDIEPLVREKMKDLAKDIANLVSPYEETTSYSFQKPMITIFKNPFKKLTQAAGFYNAGDVNSGLAILKAYADDKTLKPNLQAMAAYNYGLGLFVAEQYDQADEQLKLAGSQGSSPAIELDAKVADEKRLIKRQQEIAEQARITKAEADNPPPAATPVKPKSKKNVRKSK